MTTFSLTFRRIALLGLMLSLLSTGRVSAADAVQLEAKPAAAFFEKFSPVKAPAPGALLLKTGDRLAICGDSITEQKMYSRIMETYLTVCVPELKITTRQYGWSGETAEGFLRRMESDCLRFKPTVATTCYGMNDFKYRPYDEANGQWYREQYTAVARKFKDAGVRVVLGSAGCVGKVASWVKSGSGTVDDHNLSLCTFRNIDIEIAAKERLRFADIFWPMYTASYEARQKFGPDYAVSGNDGVHPGWAGHLIMAYEYLKALGLQGDLGTFTMDLKAGRAKASAGHRVVRFTDNVLTVTSSRYPFCATGELNKDTSLRSGMALVPFNQDLNRMRLVVNNGTAASYKITWGAESKTYTRQQLEQGVNLAADFPVNPFSAAFERVDKAVAAKQAYETTQIKNVFHGQEGRADMAAAVTRTEAVRAPLVKAVKDAFVPVTHAIRIEAQ